MHEYFFINFLERAYYCFEISTDNVCKDLFLLHIGFTNSLFPLASCNWQKGHRVVLFSDNFCLHVIFEKITQGSHKQAFWEAIEPHLQVIFVENVYDS